MRVGFLQYTPEFGRIDENIDRVEGLLSGIRADLLVLPELFATGYQFRHRQELTGLAEPVRGDTAAALQGIAGRTGALIVAGFPEIEGDRVFNSAMLVSASGLLGTYRKVHLFHREKEIFEPGDTGFSTWQWRGARIGVMVCFDWYFPEAARTLALAGAEIIAHPANLVLAHCQKAMPIRCLENRVFSVTANRCGTESRIEPSLTFTGRSLIASPAAEVLASAGPEGDDCQVVEVDLDEARDKRPTPKNHAFEDRRTDLYRLD